MIVTLTAVAAALIVNVGVYSWCGRCRGTNGAALERTIDSGMFRWSHFVASEATLLELVAAAGQSAMIAKGHAHDCPRPSSPDYNDDAACIYIYIHIYIYIMCTHISTCC